MNKIKISLGLNLLIVLLTIVSTVMMFTGFRFMHGYEVVLETTKLGVFRFFTVDSNMLMGLIALLFSIDEIRVLRGKEKSVPTKSYILKLMGTTAVTLTFVVVIAYLGPITEYGLPSLLMNSNLFFT